MSNGELCFEDKCFPILTVTFLHFNIFSMNSAFLQEKKTTDIVERTCLCQASYVQMPAMPSNA